MAKGKRGSRIIVGLKCSVTGMVNYVVSKNRMNTQEKLQLSKFNPKLKKHTLHVETTKLK